MTATATMIPNLNDLTATSKENTKIAWKKKADCKANSDNIRFNPNANLLAGGFGGICSLVVGFPFDTVKVRLQTMPTKQSAYQCFKSIVVHEGPMALFRGLSGLACVALPRFALMFHSNAVSRNLLFQTDSSTQNYIHIAMSGALSQILVVPFIVTPLERIKVIMQTDPKVPGQLACFKKIIFNEGFRGLFKGTLITYARDMPSFATYFLVYEVLKNKFFDKDSESAKSNSYSKFIGTAAAGATAGIAGWAVAIPTDVVKNRHQVNALSTSAFQNAKDLFQQRGSRGFFLGAGPILLRAAPANAAAFLGYEAAISFLAYFYKSEL